MKLNFCPECAAPLLKHSETDYTCTNGHPFYNGPHTSCSVLLLNEQNEILVVKRRREPKQGKYDVPGGFLNHDEDGYQGARREAKEELGIDIALDDLEPIDCALHHYLENDTACGIAFLCRKWRGELRAGDDAAELAWKPLAYITSSDMAWPYPRLYNKLRKLRVS